MVVMVVMVMRVTVMAKDDEYIHVKILILTAQ